MGLFDKLSQRMKKTSSAISDRLDEIVNYYKEIDDDLCYDHRTAMQMFAPDRQIEICMVSTKKNPTTYQFRIPLCQISLRVSCYFIPY